MDRFTQLHTERTQAEAQLAALTAAPKAADPALLDEIPYAGDIFSGLPPALLDPGQDGYHDTHNPDTASAIGHLTQHESGSIARSAASSWARRIDITLMPHKPRDFDLAHSSYANFGHFGRISGQKVCEVKISELVWRRMPVSSERDRSIARSAYRPCVLYPAADHCLR
jgi:hypothetical protein